MKIMITDHLGKKEEVNTKVHVLGLSLHDDHDQILVFHKDHRNDMQ